MIGVINFDVLEEIKIPAVYLKFIEKESWKER